MSFSVPMLRHNSSVSTLDPMITARFEYRSASIPDKITVPTASAPPTSCHRMIRSMALSVNSSV